MALVERDRKNPLGYVIKAATKQGQSCLVAIDLPSNEIKSGDMTITPVTIRRPLANEISIGVKIRKTRKYFVFGDKRTTLSVDIRANRFARVGKYDYSVEAKDENGQLISLSLSISVEAGDEYRPRSLDRPEGNLLSKAESLKPVMVNNGNKEATVPVVMAVWKRLDNLQGIIDDLKRQTRKSRLVLWLNDPSLLMETRGAISREDDLHITVYCSDNIGGFGRFYAAKNEDEEIVVFLDDDQRLSSDSIERLMGVYSPLSIVGQWSFRFHHPNNYWLKDKPLKGVVEADYIGTGGMVMDTKVLHDKRLYSDIPDEFWFIEDLWLSWFAVKYYGYRLYSLNAGIEIIKDSKDQMSSLIDKKTEFYKYLSKKGANWSGRMNRLSRYDTLAK